MRMAPKAFLLLGLLMAVVLLISSEVSARDLAEKTAEKTEETNGVYDAKYRPPEYGKYPPGREYGGGNPAEKPPTYIGGVRNCNYGCCSGSGAYYGGGCQRCCSYAGEKVDVETEVKPHN